MKTPKEKLGDLMAYITTTASASSEEDINKLLLMMAPSDSKGEMGEIYSEVLGYNPISYFDRQYLEKQYDELLTIAPSTYYDDLIVKRPEIIDRVMTVKNVVDDDYITHLLVTEIANNVGWNDPDLLPNLMHRIHEELESCGGFEVDMDIEDFDEMDDDDDDEIDSYDTINAEDPDRVNDE